MNIQTATTTELLNLIHVINRADVFLRKRNITTDDIPVDDANAHLTALVERMIDNALLQQFENHLLEHHELCLSDYVEPSPGKYPEGKFVNMMLRDYARALELGR